MSAETVGALARKRSEDPGVERHERRGRLRERADMFASLLARKGDFDPSGRLLTRESRITPVEGIFRMGSHIGRCPSSVVL